jgi:adenylate cyclase
MPQEIEHKYLVRLDVWKPPDSGVPYRQGYLSSAKDRVVRVRTAGEQAFLTIKGPASGITRLEFEYAIPIADAATLLDTLCGHPLIEKTRYRQLFAGKKWEIDVFQGDNAGLVVAELEVTDESEQFEPPPWLGREVSGDPRYFNSNLASNPYKNWRTQRD